MRIFRYDNRYRFYSIFDTKRGGYYRSGILQEETICRETDPFCTKAIDTGIDPFQASFPELLDIGIMGHCIHGKTGLCLRAGVECYQNGLHSTLPNMSLSDYRLLMGQCRHQVFQVALGGCGDPDQHESFQEILECTCKHRIVPNFTTSGFWMTEKIAELCKSYCGAVAISWYRSPYTTTAIQTLLNAGVKTNIHYVLSNGTLREAYERLQKRDFPFDINAVIFLLHKPIGLGTQQQVIQKDNALFWALIELVDHEQFPFKVGFDSCTIPALRGTKQIDPTSLDSCEGARWSAYISSDMKMMPCSFDSQKRQWAVSLRTHTIQEAWESPEFEDFRNRLRVSCPDCPSRSFCQGGCPICPEIVLCR